MSSASLPADLIRRGRGACAVVALLLGAPAAAAPYALDDIRLNASFESSAGALDLRDTELALRDARARGAGKPDLGRRGYGCMRRADPYADLTCVTHDARVDGIETREIRLHFIGGVLLQFSITAEIRYLDEMLAALERRFGAPAAGPGGGARYVWRNGESSIEVHRGPSLVFVSFESAGYDAAVRRRSGAAGR